MAGRVYHKCPECGKVSYFAESEALVCRQCGHAPGAAADPGPAPISQAAVLGIAGLAADVAALLATPLSPFAWLLLIAGFVLGLLAIVQREEEDSTALVWGILAMVGAVVMFLFVLMLWNTSYVYYSSGGCDVDCGGGSGGGTGGDGGSGGSGGGGSGGGSSGAGGSGGAGGGSGGGVDVGGGGVDAPFPALPFVLATLFLLRRRHA